MNSNSPRIQAFFAVLVLLSLLFGGQLAALFYRRPTQPTLLVNTETGM